MLPFRRILVSLLIPALSPLLARAQAPISPPPSPSESARAYQNAAEGLRMQLQDILAVARNHDAPKLESLTKQMEIRNYEEWFAKAYGNERGELRAAPYARDLARNESDFQALFLQLANDEGEIATRNVNDAPAPGMEEHMLDGLQGAAQIFFASWKKRDAPPVSRGNPIGYFVFLDGSFRLLRAFRIMAIRPMTGSGAVAPRGTWSATTGPAPDNLPDNRPATGPVLQGVRIASPPSCDYCPAAEYSDAARKKGLEGTVVLQVIVQPDGSATDIQVVKSPDPELTQMAMDSVSRWRFKPARNSDGEPVRYREAIEVSFRLAR